MMKLTNDEIRLTERAHYSMQLSAYFTELVDLPGMRFAFTTRLPDTWYNQAYDIDWEGGSEEELGAMLTDVCAARQRVPCVYLSSACRPTNIAETVHRLGLVEFEEEAWMFLPMDAVPANITTASPDIEIVDVDIHTNFDEFAYVYRHGLPGPDVEAYIDSVRFGLRYAPPGVQVRYLLAYVDERPVGMLSILTTNECSGVYAVATLEEFQRHGVARTLSMRAEQIARTNRSRYLFLQTVVSDEGEQAFNRIGFQTVFTRKGYTTAEEAESINHG